jgi:hypothetical protein
MALARSKTLSRKITIYKKGEGLDSSNRELD